MQHSTIDIARLLAAIVLIVLSPATGLRADETKVLHFPAGQNLGQISVEGQSRCGWGLEAERDPSFPFGLDPERVCLDGDWDDVGQARGDVAVPVGRNLRLAVLLGPTEADRSGYYADTREFLADFLGTTPTDLSGLSRLDPNDLCYFGVGALARVSDLEGRVLEPISRLTGLRILSLSRTGITDEQMGFLRPLQSLRALELHMELSIRNAGLAVLQELPALEYLDLETGVTDVGLRHLSGLRKLRWMRLRTGRTWGPGLAELAKLPRLERLALWGETGLSDRQVHFLEGLTNLKSLTLWGGNVPLTDASLASIGKLTSLEELYFIQVDLNFTDAGMAHLERLKRLRRIGFTFCVLGAEGMQHLANLPNLECLKGVAPTADGATVLPSFPKLKSLEVNFCIPPIGTPVPPELVAAVGQLQGLEELLLMGGQWSQRDLLVLGKLRHLKHLNLFVHEEYSDPVLAEIAKLSDLESFSLWGKGVSKRGLNQLQALTKLHALSVTPFVQGEPPLDETPLKLSALKNLRSLGIHGVSLQDADLATLSELHGLTSLGLGNGTFSEAGLRHLQPLTALTSLTLGDVDCPPGTDLAWLAGFQKLTRLKLYGRLSDEAVRRLPGFPLMRGLTLFTDEEIEPETLAWLRGRLPSIMQIHVHELPRIENPPAQPKTPRIRSTPARTNRQPSRRRRR